MKIPVAATFIDSSSSTAMSKKEYVALHILQLLVAGCSATASASRESRGIRLGKSADEGDVSHEHLAGITMDQCHSIWTHAVQL